VTNRNSPPCATGRPIQGLATTSRRAVLGMAFAASLQAMADPARPRDTLRIAISDSLVGNLNPNDARAALLVWIDRTAKLMNVPVTLTASVFEPYQAIAQKLDNGQLDAAALNAVEYWRLMPKLDQSLIAVPTYAGGSHIQLLARRSAGRKGIADLKGCRLLVHDNARMSAATAWLHTLTHKHGLGDPADHFSRMEFEPRPQKVALPVFFGHADACLILEPVVSSLLELNPKMAQELVSIETSPELLSGAYGLRPGASPMARQALMGSMDQLDTNAAGRQMLAIFQMTALRAEPGSRMDSTVGVIREAVRLGWKDLAGVVDGGGR
jgi:ABC-type phosphate/phosphonate transport system substrate-binding protein